MKRDKPILADQLQRQGISRRTFMKFCSSIGSAVALTPAMAAQMAEKLAYTRRQSVIWLSFQECTGCTESITRAHKPNLESLIFDFVSLDYHHTLQAASGHAAEEAREAAMHENGGQYLLIVDGSIPLKDGGVYSTIAGMTNLDMLQQVAADAAAIVSVGTCAAFGGLPKAETRALAARFALPVADKPDSQDICFVPNGSYARVVEKLRPGAAEPGEIVDLAGRVLGRHAGVIHFTIGQRRGLGVGGTAEPLYVVGLEPDESRVVVGPRAALARDRVRVKELNWLDDAVPSEGRPVTVKLRSAQAAVPATVFALGDGAAEVVLEAPQHGVAPGQAAVFYDGPRLLGGGWIAATELSAAA